MSTLAEIALFVIRTLGSLYLLLVLLRFLFQLVRADFYNPISQFVAKATNPLLMPLRRLIPGFYGIDLACLVLALLVAWAGTQLILTMAGYGFQNPVAALAWAFVSILSTILSIYFWGLLAVIVASWVAPFSHHPALVLLRQLIEPIMTPVRKLIPPMGGLDFSPIVVMMGLHILNHMLLPELARALGAPARPLLGF